MNSQDPMIDNNDPRLTAYALGELAPEDTAQIEAALKSSPELRAVVADIRRASESISNVFLTEPPLQLTPEQKSQLLVEAESASNFDVHPSDADPVNDVDAVKQVAANATPAVTGDYYQPSSSSRLPWLKIAIVAGLASVLIGGGFYFSHFGGEPIAVRDSVFEEAQSGAESSEKEPDASLPSSSIGQELAKPQEDSEFGKDSMQQPFSEAKEANDSFEYSANLSRQAGEADATLDKKFNPQERMSRLRKLASNKMDNPAAESLSLNFPDAKPEAESNSNTLALAQESLDRSLLGTLNLTVVARSAGKGLEQIEGGAGGGASLSSPTMSRPLGDNAPVKKSLKASEAVPSLPATLAVQISDQEAKRVVELLAYSADPLQKRKLSFNDLIASQASPEVAKRLASDEFPGSDSVDSEDDDSQASLSPEDTTAFRKMDARAASPELLQQVAAATLATKLREFGNRPLLASLGSDMPSIARGTAFDDADAASEYGVAPSTAAAKQAPSGRGFEGQASPNKTNNVGDKQFESSKDGTFKSPQTVLDNQPKNRQRLSREFDFNYSQVIQQLKLKLEVRNQSLPDSK